MSTNLNDGMLLQNLEDNCYDLRCLSVPTGGDDYDVEWQVIAHYMAEPREREVARGRTVREALARAWYV